MANNNTDLHIARRAKNGFIELRKKLRKDKIRLSEKKSFQEK